MGGSPPLFVQLEKKKNSSNFPVVSAKYFLGFGCFQAGFPMSKIEAQTRLRPIKRLKILEGYISLRTIFATSANAQPVVCTHARRKAGGLPHATHVFSFAAKRFNPGKQPQEQGYPHFTRYLKNKDNLTLHPTLTQEVYNNLNLTITSTSLGGYVQ